MHGRGVWVFLAVVAVAYAVTGFLEPGIALQAIGAFLTMLGEVAPIFVFVIVLLFLAERYLGAKRTRAWLGHGSGLKGWLLAVATGVLSTGPIYAWYELLANLRRKGMRTALVSTVLYARAIKLPLLPLMVHYFGLTYTLVLSLLIATFSVVNGLAMERLAGRTETQ